MLAIIIGLVLFAAGLAFQVWFARPHELPVKKIAHKPLP
jgi:hypothetical protein